MRRLRRRCQIPKDGRSPAAEIGQFFRNAPLSAQGQRNDEAAAIADSERRQATDDGSVPQEVRLYLLRHPWVVDGFKIGAFYASE
jgi:hypothetical protein